MTEKAHSPVGASGRKRWANCPGSVRLSAGIKPSSSIYAAEGTVAHGIAEECLNNGWLAKRFIGEKRSADGFEFTVDEAMAEAVQVYLDEVRFLCKGGRFELMVEHTFHLEELHPDLYGTADAIVWKPEQKELWVLDFKYGAGVPVDAEENPQGLYYALGALLETGLPARSVYIGIVQPRCEHAEGPVRHWCLPAIDLLEEADKLLAEVKATEDPEAETNPGEWCQFCPAAALCPELKDMAVTAVHADQALDYSPEELADSLDLVPRLKGWIKAVETFALERAEAGNPVPRYKLVEKRATRKWSDDGDAIIGLRKYGLDDEDIYTRSLRTVAQIEKKVGKAAFAEAFSAVVVKESSGLTLVPESDKRPAVTAGGFNNLDEE